MSSYTQGMKELMVCASILDHSTIDQLTGWVQTRAMNSKDRQEGGRAFVEKRRADWLGK